MTAIVPAEIFHPTPEISTAKRFVVVPDGILNLLPFEALQNSDGQYLLKSRIVSYAPSASVLNSLRRSNKQQATPRPFLGVGDVAYENQGGAGKRIPASETSRGRFVRGFADFAGMPLHDLPQTREEVQSISRIAGENAVTLLHSRMNHLVSFGYGSSRLPMWDNLG
jgi:CHAT domain-containing protein